ncbi:MAG: hypothetical protein AAGA55_05040 [Planctomycetota bacterium]
MMDSVARWVVRGVSLLLIGPLAAGIAGGVRAIDGSQAATLLTGEGMTAGVIALVGVGVCVVVAAGVAALVCDRHEAVLNAGFVMAWVAWTSGRMGEAYRLVPEAGTLIRIALEAGFVIGVAVVAMLVADRLARRPARDEGLALSGTDFLAALRSKQALPTVGVSLGLSLLLAWLFARHDAPGQSLGTAFFCGLGAGVFGSLAGQSVAAQAGSAPQREAPGVPAMTAVFVPIVVGVLLAGVLGAVIGLFIPGPGKLLTGVIRQELPGWSLVTPMAWGAGAMIGVPAGISFLQPRHEADTSRLARREG